MIVKGKHLPPVTFDGVLAPETEQKSVLEQLKRALEAELKKLQAKYGKS